MGDYRLEEKNRRSWWPGFKILDGYITRKFLGTFFLAIALIIIIVVVFDAVEKIDDFIEMKAPLKAIILGYYVNFIPYFINLFCGLFTFIAVIYFTSQMAGRTEITAIQASGVSFRRLLWPYFVSAMFITAISLFLNLQVIPSANEQRVEFEGRYLRKNRRVQYEPHIYRQIEPGVFVYMRNYNPSTNKASFMTIERFEGSAIVESLEASDISYNDKNGHWEAPKYATHRFVGEEDIFELHTTRLDTLINLTEQELGKVENLITTMKIGELNLFIEQQKQKGSDMIGIFEVERQKRFSYPLSVFILTVIGVSLSARKMRSGTGVNIGIGVILCFTYIMMGRVFEEIAKNNDGAISILLVWLPNLIFALIAAFIYRKAPK
ncbi:MAG: LptF/LptG family permease [Tidjanibacter sp.]|nr:LptF/LptG family permease [Tidjanibacter sp.]